MDVVPECETNNKKDKDEETAEEKKEKEDKETEKKDSLADELGDILKKRSD